MYDEDGNDVTPAPLVQVENALNKGPSKGSVGGDQSADGTASVSITIASLFCKYFFLLSVWFVDA